MMYDFHCTNLLSGSSKFGSGHGNVTVDVVDERESFKITKRAVSEANILDWVHAQPDVPSGVGKEQAKRRLQVLLCRLEVHESDAKILPPP